jgi:hypothetical protein
MSIDDTPTDAFTVPLPVLTDADAPPTDWEREAGEDAPPRDHSADEITAAFLAWVVSFLGEMESAPSRDAVPWCPTWWVHPEVTNRLMALWKAYVEATGSLDMRAVSSWWVDHWDRHAHTLFSSTGPFRYCTRDTHHKTKHDTAPNIPVSRPDEGWVVPGLDT